MEAGVKTKRTKGISDGTETNAGRIGRAETLSVTVLSLISTGLFSAFEAGELGTGFAAVLTRPAALLLSLAPVLAAALTLRGNGETGLGETLRMGLGKAAPIAALPLAFSLTLTAALPLAEFTGFIRSFMFDSVPILSVLAFVIPVFAYAALAGLEPEGRAACILLPLAAAALVIAILPAAHEFEPRRLLPFPSPGEAAKGVPAGVSLFLPVLSALLINLGGIGGAERAGRYAAVSAAVSAAVIFAALAALGLVYPAPVLRGMSLPLARIDFLSIKQSYALRLDKVLAMVWLAGSMLAQAYCVYSAARLMASSFGTPLYGPFALALSIAAGGLVLACENALGAGRAALRLYSRAGFLLPIPTLAAGALSGVLTRRKKQAPKRTPS